MTVACARPHVQVHAHAVRCGAVQCLSRVWHKSLTAGAAVPACMQLPFACMCCHLPQCTPMERVPEIHFCSQTNGSITENAFLTLWQGNVLAVLCKLWTICRWCGISLVLALCQLAIIYTALFLLVFLVNRGLSLGGSKLSGQGAKRSLC